MDNKFINTELNELGWRTINRGTDLLAFHLNSLSSIFAPLTREILNFLKMERLRYLCTLRIATALVRAALLTRTC